MSLLKKGIVAVFVIAAAGAVYQCSKKPDQQQPRATPDWTIPPVPDPVPQQPQPDPGNRQVQPQPVEPQPAPQTSTDPVLDQAQLAGLDRCILEMQTMVDAQYLPATRDVVREVVRQLPEKKIGLGHTLRMCYTAAPSISMLGMQLQDNQCQDISMGLSTIDQYRSVQAQIYRKTPTQVELGPLGVRITGP